MYPLNLLVWINGLVRSAVDDEMALHVTEKGGSYYESHRRRGGSSGLPAEAAQKLMHDRGEYQAFLEIQLERVSAACTKEQGFTGRIDELAAVVAASNEKIVNLAKVCACVCAL